jgi:hypothetical protein
VQVDWPRGTDGLIELDLVDHDGVLIDLDVTAAKAELDIGPLTVSCNTVLEATTAGVAGNLLTMTFVGDGAGVGNITRSVNAFTYHFAPSISTVLNFETLVNALAGADDLIAVKTSGANNILNPGGGDEFGPTAFVNGATGDERLEFSVRSTLGGDPLFSKLAIKAPGAVGRYLFALVNADTIDIFNRVIFDVWATVATAQRQVVAPSYFNVSPRMRA